MDALPASTSHEADVEDRYPLSPLQLGMLAQSRFAPGSGAFVQHAICDLCEAIDCATLESAWRDVIDRHGALRTGFTLSAVGGPTQDVHRRVRVVWSTHDWGEMSSLQQAEASAAFLDDDRRRDVDVEQAPLMRLAVFRLADTHYRLLWTYHHALLDGRAVRVVLRDVFDTYDAIVASRAVPRQAQRPYRDYVTSISTRDATSARYFWQTYLRDLPAPSRLLDHAVDRSDVDAADAYATVEFKCSSASTAALSAIAERHELTLNTLLLAAWAQLLSRFTDEPDVVFGVTMTLRAGDVDGLRDMVGLCINTVPMRVRVLPNVALLDLLKAVRSQWLAMRDHAWASLASIHEWCGISRDVTLMRSLVVFENQQLDAALHDDRPDWTHRRFTRRSGAGHPLTVVAFGAPALTVKIVYERARFDAATVDAMLSQLKTLLETSAVDLELAVSARPLLDARQRHRVVVEWNATDRDFAGGDAPVHELFAQQAARSPSATAVEWMDQKLSYARLNARANQLARYLRHACAVAGPGSLVGICMHRSPDVIVAMFGVLKAGGAYLVLDAAYPNERVTALLEDAKLSTVIATHASAAAVAGFHGHTILLDGHRESIAQESDADPERRGEGLDPAYAVYTSGSSGRPKAVVVPHRALTNHTLALAERYDFRATDRRLQFVSLSSDVLIAEVFPVLTRGGTLVLRLEAAVSSITDFLNCLETLKITVVSFPSAFWHEWVLAMSSSTMPMPSSLRVVVSGMDSARADLLATWKSMVAGRVRWFNAYGPSEATCTATGFEADATDDTVRTSVPIGRPLPNVRVYILDAHGNPVAPMMPGELYIGGRGVALGYLHRADLTAERFVPDVFGDAASDRLYRTGDRARYLPDGNIEFLGRCDGQIKIRGFRVEPGEIEVALQRLSDVRDAAVVVHGETGYARHLTAYVVAARDGRPTPAGLWAQLQATLPEYMLPSAIVVLPVMPLTPSGKIDRKALPEPTEMAWRRSGERAIPRDPLEHALLGIWQDVLGVRDIGICDSFFELGGDSLLAVQMMDAVARTCGRTVALATLFDGATIEHLARALKRGTDALQSPVVALHVAGNRPPFLFLHGDYSGGGFYTHALARVMGPEQPFYAVHPHGLDNSGVPSSIEAMAADRVRAVRQACPRGPYVVGGHCAGGLVALEMARLLMAQGDAVAAVVLIDIRAPWKSPTVSTGRAARRRSAAASSVTDVQRALALSSASVSPNAGATERYRVAVARYVPQPLLARLIVLRSETMHDFRQSLGWSLVGREVETHAIPGDHFSSITRHVGAVGARIRASLDAVLAR